MPDLKQVYEDRDPREGRYENVEFSERLADEEDMEALHRAEQADARQADQAYRED